MCRISLILNRRMLSLAMLNMLLWSLIPAFSASSFNFYTAPIPDTPAICLVTVDTGLVKNIILWKKIANQHIKYYKIYKEIGGPNNWDSIGFRMFDSLSYFIDNSSFPKIKSAKYRLSAVDSSGNESPMSPYHRTVNLLIQKSNGWYFDLLWSPYEGFSINYYRIWRWSPTSGWVKIDSVQSNIHSYNDNPPPGLVYYMIETSPPHPCQLSKAQTNYNTSRSNRASTSIFLSTELTVDQCHIALFPNPSNDRTYIAVNHPTAKHLSLDLYSVSGHHILHYNHVLCNQGACLLYIDNKKLALPVGFYFIKISINGNIYTKKLVINNP